MEGLVCNAWRANTKLNLAMQPVPIVYQANIPQQLVLSQMSAKIVLQILMPCRAAMQKQTAPATRDRRGRMELYVSIVCQARTKSSGGVLLAPSVSRGSIPLRLGLPPMSVKNVWPIPTRQSLVTKQWTALATQVLQDPMAECVVSAWLVNTRSTAGIRSARIARKGRFQRFWGPIHRLFVKLAQEISTQPPAAFRKVIASVMQDQAGQMEEPV